MTTTPSLPPPVLGGSALSTLYSRGTASLWLLETPVHTPSHPHEPDCDGCADSNRILSSLASIRGLLKSEESAAGRESRCSRRKGSSSLSPSPRLSSASRQQYDGCTGAETSEPVKLRVLDAENLPRRRLCCKTSCCASSIGPPIAATAATTDETLAAEVDQSRAFGLCCWLHGGRRRRRRQPASPAYETAGGEEAAGGKQSFNKRQLSAATAREAKLVKMSSAEEAIPLLAAQSIPITNRCKSKFDFFR